MNRTWPWLLAVVLVGCASRGSEDGGFDGGVDSGFDGGTDGGLDGGADGGLDGGTDAGCTAAPGPVKVLVILDQSGSMCLTDPPGSQATAGFCETINVVPPGVTQPARTLAVSRFVGGRPDVAVVQFDLNVHDETPATGFGFPNPSTIRDLQVTLGSRATDYEGVLEHAFARISADISATRSTDPALVARTRYVVILLSDGVPFPRCSANDALGTYADSTSPGGIWADSPGASSFCNDPGDGGADTIPGFVPGTDRNQNAALFGLVDQMRALVQQEGVGDVRLNTMLLFNADNVALCGAICQDVYGVFPNVAPADYPAAALAVSRYTLQTLAAHGGGAYVEFLNNGDGGVRQVSFDGFDVAGITCP